MARPVLPQLGRILRCDCAADSRRIVAVRLWVTEGPDSATLLGVAVEAGHAILCSLSLELGHGEPLEELAPRRPDPLAPGQPTEMLRARQTK